MFQNSSTLAASIYHIVIQYIIWLIGLNIDKSQQYPIIPKPIEDNKEQKERKGNINNNTHIQKHIENPPYCTVDWMYWSNQNS